MKVKLDSDQIMKLYFSSDYEAQVNKNLIEQ